MLILRAVHYRLCSTAPCQLDCLWYFPSSVIFNFAIIDCYGLTNSDFPTVVYLHEECKPPSEHFTMHGCHCCPTPALLNPTFLFVRLCSFFQVRSPRWLMLVFLERPMRILDQHWVWMDIGRGGLVQKAADTFPNIQYTSASSWVQQQGLLAATCIYCWVLITSHMAFKWCLCFWCVYFQKQASKGSGTR